MDSEKTVEQIEAVQRQKRDRQADLVKRIGYLNGQIKLLQDELRNAEMESVALAATISQADQFLQILKE